MNVRTNAKAGGFPINHNETLVVRTDAKAGVQKWYNHNEPLVVRTDAKGGGRTTNHNETLR